jgi:ABC-2 type transport system ATP-binding protein
MGWLRTEPGVRVVEFDGGYALFEADEAAAQRVLRAALDAAPVQQFSPVRPRLAEIFRDIVRDEERHDDEPATTKTKETVR